MKIAMTISGQPRRLESGFYELNKHFLSKYDIDVYMHSWKDEYYYKYHYGQLMHKYKADMSAYDKALELYQPKKHLFEKGIRFDSYGIEDVGRFDSHFGMTLSIKRAWDLLESSGIQYDYIIRARFDLLFSHYTPINHPYLTDITQLDPNKIHSFKHSFDRDGIWNINDQFGIGGYNAMKVYHNFFPNLINYYFRNSEYKIKMNDSDSSHLYIETSLLQYLHDNNIETTPEQEINLHESLLGSNFTHSYDTPRIMR
jgi:hypothetical protein